MAFVAMLSGAAVSSVRAQTTYYWDANGNSSGTGGTGTWGSSNVWRANSSGGTLGSWANNNNAVFGGTTGTVSWASNINVRRITFGVSGYTLQRTSNTLTLVTDGIIDTGNFNATISGPMAGTVGMTKIGTGTLTLSGANTYTGTTNIGTAGGTSGGTLLYGANNVINTGAVSVYAGTLDINSRTDTIGALNLGGGAAGTTANVIGTTGTLTLGGNVTFNATNNANGATISANLGLGGSNRTFTINNSTAANDDLTVSGTISGTGGLIKSGNGVLKLSGTNTYTGTTTLSAGTLAIASNSALGGGTLSLNGGTLTASGGARSIANSLTLTANSTIAGSDNLTLASTLINSGGNRTLTINNSGATTLGNINLSNNNTGRTLTIAGTGNSTISGIITNGGTGAGNLTKSGSGTLTLTGANTYTGTTTISAGTLQIGAGGTTGSIAGTSIVNNAALAFDRSNDLIYVGVISGTGSVTKAGNGTLMLTGANTYTGATTISGGTLQIGSGGTTGSIASTSIVNNAALLFNRSNALTYSGVISGSGSVIKAGSGTLTLSGSNTYTGNTTIQAGILQTTGSNRIADGSNLHIGGSGTFQFDWGGNSETVGALSGSGTLSLRGSTFTTSTSADTFFSGTITDNYGVFRKAGTGNLTLTGNNTYTGITYIDGGTLIAASSNALGGSTSGNVIANNATLALQGGITLTEGSFSVQGTGDGGVGAIYNISDNNTLAATLNLAAPTTLGSAAGTLSLGGLSLGSNVTFAGNGNFASNGAITGSGTLIKTGAGTLTLSGGTDNNSYGATNVNEGTVILAKSDGISALGQGAITIGDGSGGASSAIVQLAANNQIVDYAPSITFNSDGRLDLNGYSETLNVISGSGGQITLGGGSLALGVSSGSSTFGGTITGAGTFTKLGAGVVTLSGANTYTAATMIDAGILRAGAANAFSASSAVSLANVSGAILDLNGFNQSIGSLSGGGSTGGNVTLGSASLTVGADNSSTTFGGGVSGSGNLIKVGSGNLTLTGSSTYTGTTTISGGTLQIGAGGTTGSIASTSIINNASVAFNRSDDTSFSGTISGSGTLTKLGAGTLTLTNANTYTGVTTINNGTLQLNGASVLSNPDIIVNATTPGTTATFALASSATQTINSLTFGGTGATSTSTNNVSLDSGSTLTLGGNVTYLATNNPLGSTISGAGTLSLGSGQRTFNIGNSSNATTDLAISSNITGTGSLLKTGAGTLSLSGSNNTFSGGVIVDQGTLLAVGTTSEGGFKALGDYNSVVVPTTVVTVNNGATLAVQNTSFAPPATQTTQLLNISLSGTGADGGGALQNLGGLNTWLGNISLAGNTTIQNHQGGNNNTLFLGPYVAISPTAVELNNNALTFIGAGDVYISSALGKSTGDTGSLNVNLTNGGYGTGVNSITLAGPQNFYTGATTVNNGWLRMLVDAGNHPNAGILGSLTIGDGIGGANTAVVSNYYIEQIADNAAVTIKSDGLLDLASGSVNETLSNITLQGGRIATGTGNLYMTGTIAAQTASTSTIDGNIGMLNSGGGPARIFSVDSGSTLLVNAKLFGGDYNKTGDGRMIVTSDSLSSGYNGLTTVQGGTLTLRHSGALGQHTVGAASSGTVVQNGATLQLDGTSSNLGIQYEALTLAGSGYNNQGALNSLAGTNTWTNATITLSDSATINTDNGTLSIGGRIGSTAGVGQTQTLTVTGSGNTNITGSIKDNIGPSPTYTDLHTGTLALNKTGSGTLTLSGLNTFTGAININQGTLAVTANNSLGAQTNAVTVQSGATFALSGGNNYTNTIGRLEGTGVVSIASATVLKVNNTTANTFDGRLSGQGLFDKVGAGTFTFSSTANTDAFNFDGTVRLSNGTLEFAGGSGVLNTSTDALFINTLELTGGTLLLSEAFINVGTLNITGDTILDFGATGHSILNATNIYIAAGKTLLIRNWTSEVDFLFANGDFRQNNGSGTIALFNQIGTQPENQVHFEGDPQSPDGSHTTWINYGYDGFTNWEIRPIPEPSTYGVILTASSLAFLLYRRSRKAKSKS